MRKSLILLLAILISANLSFYKIVYAADIVDQNDGIDLKARKTTQTDVIKITWLVTNTTLAIGANFFTLQYNSGGSWYDQLSTDEPSSYSAPVYMQVPSEDCFCFRMVATKNGSGSILGSGTSGNCPPCAEPPPPPDQDDDGIPDYIDNCISVSNPTQLNTDTDQLGDACDSDDDNDGLPDTFEDANNNLNSKNSADAAMDFDNDGLSNLTEYNLGTKLDDSDSDDDGFSDRTEVNRGTDPNDPNSVPKIKVMPWIPLLLDD